MNLRISSVKVLNSTSILAIFTEKLNQNISINNIIITSQTPNIPSPQVLKVNIFEDQLEITTQPLTPFAAYFIEFFSTDLIIFRSLNGEAVLYEDGITNKEFFVGPIEDSNPSKQYFDNYFIDNLYDLDSSTNVGKYIQALSLVLSKSLYDIRQSKNENYLSFNVIDEKKTRGSGPFDRLNEEGAYEIIRVGKLETNNKLNLEINVNDFSFDLITLLKQNYSEKLTTSSSDLLKTFNINSFVLNLSKRFVYKLNSIVFNYTDARPPYKYDIEKFGYQINNSKYDKEFAFTYLLLKDNQIKLSEKVLEDSNFSIKNIFNISVSYEYKDTGRNIDTTSVSLYSVFSSTREVLSPLKNVFNLKKAPIVKNSGKSGDIGDIVFTDPNTLTLSKHPAFLYEILFRLDYLPSRPGEYSVDYETGTVYVFGENYNNTGTGEYPPLATYKYKYTYKELIDYNLDGSDVSALPNGSIVGENVKISFNYEQTLAKDIDYKSNPHLEILNERILNNLIALNALKTQNSPITNVFRIFNETTGEIYKPIRWSDNKVYFSYNNTPNINEKLSERASFDDVFNEVLFVSSELSPTNILLKIFKCYLNNNNIISASEDCIGSSVNTSVNFSDKDVFIREIYFDKNISEQNNLLKLNTDGYYQIDYENGIIYVACSSDQELDLGTITYKRGYISTQNKNIISIDDIYYRINLLGKKNKQFEYTNFQEGLVLPNKFDKSNEEYLNNNTNYPYVILNTDVGTYSDSGFVKGVSDTIKFIRGFFEYNDLKNNIEPINFYSSCYFSGKNISVDKLKQKEYSIVEQNILQYQVKINKSLFYLSPNINLNVKITRIYDGCNLWDNSGTIVLGNELTFILSGINNPIDGQSVLVEYEFSINNNSHVVIDYNKGDYYIDYNYLSDEIIISYEYGDNTIDFRESSILNENDTYYVSYKVGALRDGLLKNFGSTIGIPILNTFDIDLNRELYRNSLSAALQSFLTGPTKSSIENIVNKIVKTSPEIIESSLLNWVLGNSYLSREKIKSSGNFSLIPAKYGNGVLINSDNQRITFPISSNLRLEEGTLETWIIPQWNGIDNDATLKINILKDGYFISENEVFIGSSEKHYEYSYNSNDIILSKKDIFEGSPQKNKKGVFIYYDKDVSNVFSRWFIDVVDGYGSSYKITINTDGKFYDLKSTTYPKPNTLSITSGISKASISIISSNLSQGITFVADKNHYLFDFAEKQNKNRFSIFKDESGYLNFRVSDNKGEIYSISSDVSNWKKSEKHHVAVSWKLNTKNQKDEMHLFIDGFEVQNIIKYGDKVKPYLHEKYRTINPEEIVDTISKNIVYSDDLKTTSGSNVVQSSLNFSFYGINVGDIIYIEENNFNTNGYIITNVNGNYLTLNSPMLFTLNDARFSINKTSFNVSTEIDIYNNIAVSLIHSFVSGNDLSTISGNNQVNSSIDFINNNVQIGDLIRISNYLFENHYTILQVNTNSLTLNDYMPSTLSGLNFNIYKNIEEEMPGTRSLKPAYEINKDGYFNNILTIKDKATADDLVLIKTLGLNHKRIKQRYYQWGNYKSILMTRLPAPVSLDEVKIYHIILSSTLIGNNNSTLMSGVFYSNNIQTSQPTNSISGRSLKINISGNNIDFSYPVEVIIDGYKATPPLTYPVPVVESLFFNEIGEQNSATVFTGINFIKVNCKPITLSKNCLTIEIKERYDLTYPETIYTNASYTPVPVIKYSYQIYYGSNMYGSGDTVYDGYAFFSKNNINNHLIIHYPVSVAGYYKILDVSDDHKSLKISQLTGTQIPLPYFSDGVYEILNTTDYRSGLQNGFFIFEQSMLPGQPYFLKQGLYEFDYYTYLSIKFDPISYVANIGTDFDGKNNINSIIDEFMIKSIQTTDVRVGEIALNSDERITKDFNKLKSNNSNSNTLMLIDFEEFPLKNNSNYYVQFFNEFVQSSSSVNDNFGRSICITDTPIIKENLGILDTKHQGTIEFWVSPLFDTSNDPEYRYYFDAAGLMTENIISESNIEVKISGQASKILSIKVLNNKKEEFVTGSILKNDGKTILLKKQLPYQRTNVIVEYIPYGFNGDRISIYKDPFGYITFEINSNQISYKIKSKAVWTKYTWHRIKAQYKINSGTNYDEIRFFVDGYEKGNLLFNNGMLFGTSAVLGLSITGQGSISSNITFNDSIGQFSIGSDYNKKNTAYALIDNFRISNVYRPIYSPFGEAIDVNYNSNISVATPVSEDLYTTLLLEFNKEMFKNTDFSILKNRETGLFDFYINIYDGFDVIKDNSKAKDILETLIKTLKPANSRAFFKYI